jgi:hypothetical protein
MKLLKSLCMILVAVSILTFSKPSQAAVGAISGNPVLVISGLKVAGNGAVALGVGVAAMRVDSPYFIALGGYTGLIGAAAICIGLVMLEDSQDINFDQVSKTDAAKLGLNSSELEIYNSEIDQVNALAAHVDHELGKLAQPTIQDSAAIWSSVQDTVSPESFKVMQKITSLLYK